jgi:hypothetical protein
MRATALGHSVSLTSRRGAPKSKGQLSGTEKFHQFAPAFGSVEVFVEFNEHCATRMAQFADVLTGTGWNKKKERDWVYIPDWDARWGEEHKYVFEYMRGEWRLRSLSLRAGLDTGRGSQ